MELYDDGEAEPQQNVYEHMDTAAGNNSDDHIYSVKEEQKPQRLQRINLYLIIAMAVAVIVSASSIGLSAYLAMRLSTLEDMMTRQQADYQAENVNREQYLDERVETLTTIVTSNSTEQIDANNQIINSTIISGFNQYRRELITLNESIELLRTEVRDGACPSNYFLNPISKTCIRLVAIKVKWATAKVNCEVASEQLAVFETHDSLMWLQNFLNMTSTSSEWKQNWMWIGLRASGGAWRWTGRSEKVIETDAASWDYGQPERTGDDNCGFVHYAFNGLHDFDCSNTLYYICERY